MPKVQQPSSQLPVSMAQSREPQGRAQATEGLFRTGFNSRAQVKCIMCDCAIRKTTVLSHWTKKHNLDKSTVLSWLSYKDGNLIHNTKARIRRATNNDEADEHKAHMHDHLLLTRATMAMSAGEQGDEDDVAGEEAKVAGFGTRTLPPMVLQIGIAKVRHWFKQPP